MKWPSAVTRCAAPAGAKAPRKATIRPDSIPARRDYAYDGLHRLERSQRGTLSGTPYDSISSPTKTQDFGLEALRNWKTFKEDDDATLDWDVLDQSRTHNAVNETTGITGGSWIVPGYDAAGNMIFAPRLGRALAPTGGRVALAQRGPGGLRPDGRGRQEAGAGRGESSRVGRWLDPSSARAATPGAGLSRGPETS